MSSTHPTPPPVQVSPLVGQPLQQPTPPARRDGVLAIDEANGDQPAQVARVDPDAWTVQRLRLWMIAAFTKSGIDSPQLCAEYLLCHVLGCKKLDLFSQPLRVLDPAQLATLRALVSRALKHEPVQYLIGAWSFYGVELLVDRRVLIPRPSTETIIDFVLSDAKSRHTVSNRLDAAMIGDDDRPIVIKPGSKAKSIAPLEIADVCTGSGAIALALAKHLPSATLTATDVSPDALVVAQANIDRSASKSRVSIAQGNLLEPLAGRVFDYIVSNPPYIPDDEWGEVAANVKDYEPHLALRAADGGLEFVRPLINTARANLRSQGVLVIELAAKTAQQAATIAMQAGYTGVEILKDSDGHDRVLIARNP